MDIAVLTTIRAASSATSSRSIIIQYQLHSKRICKDTFLFIHGIGKKKKRLENLIIHYKKEGLCTRCTKAQVNNPTTELIMNNLKKSVTVSSLRGHMPDAIVPTGLNPIRQWYLYE